MSITIKLLENELDEYQKNIEIFYSEMFYDMES